MPDIVHGCEIERPFSGEEVKATVFPIKGAKAPGWCFSMELFQKCLEIVQGDFMEMFKEFHSDGNMCWH